MDAVKGPLGIVKSGITPLPPPPPIFSTDLVQSRSSQSHLFMGSYANMHVYERKNVLIQENLIKIQYV